MAASNCQITVESRWANEVTFTGYDSATQKDNASKTVTPGSTCNRVFFESRTLSAAATYTYNLQSLTDALGVAIVATKLFGYRVENSGATITIAPDASNGATLPFSGTSPVLTVKSGGCSAHCETSSITVDATHKNVTVTNTGGVSTTYKIEFLLGQ